MVLKQLFINVLLVIIDLAIKQLGVQLWNIDYGKKKLGIDKSLKEMIDFVLEKTQEKDPEICFFCGRSRSKKEEKNEG